MTDGSDGDCSGNQRWDRCGCRNGQGWSSGAKKCRSGSVTQKGEDCIDRCGCEYPKGWSSSSNRCRSCKDIFCCKQEAKQIIQIHCSCKYSRIEKFLPMEFFSSSRIFFLEILEFSTVLEILNESSHSGHSHYFFQLAKQKPTTDVVVLHQVQESVPLAPMICQIQVTKGLEPVP